MGRSHLLHVIQEHLVAGINVRESIESIDNISSSTMLSTSCVASAYEIISIVQVLHRNGELAQFAHTDFHTCSSATIIILLDSIVHPSSTAVNQVATGMEALQFMASDNIAARARLHHVESILRAVNDALHHSNHSAAARNGVEITNSFIQEQPRTRKAGPGKELFNLLDLDFENPEMYEALFSITVPFS